jgi:hypothetical protein
MSCAPSLRMCAESRLRVEISGADNAAEEGTNRIEAVSVDSVKEISTDFRLERFVSGQMRLRIRPGCARSESRRHVCRRYWP